MPSIADIRASNSAQSSQSFTAVFVGATSGIGLGGIEALLKNSKSSKIYIIGRSKSKFESTLSRLQTLDSTAKLFFIEAQVSVLGEVSRVTEEISAKETSLDILWLSQGGLGNLTTHTLTSEGLFSDYAISYYSRLLFMQKLLPLLSKSRHPRVLSILSPSKEGPINLSDPGLKNSANYTSFWGATQAGVTMMSLGMDLLARQNPTITFLHTFPGFVATNVHNNWLKTFTGVWAPAGFLLRYIVFPAVNIFAVKAEVAGEVGIYEVTSERFGPENGNFRRLWEDGEDIGRAGEELLKRYREDGTQEVVWRHTLDEFQRVLGRS